MKNKLVQFLPNMFVCAALASVFINFQEPIQAKAAADEPSPESLEAQINALVPEKLAWRTIDWKTCLLEGIRESRKQHKPIMLWIFIDRPIDDERC